MSEATNPLPECPEGAKLIPLTQGKFAIVNADMFGELSRFKWFYNAEYAVCKLPTINGKRRSMKMHRFINQTPDGLVTDHINRVKLDNRRENLRTVTRAQNALNRDVRKNNKTGCANVWLYRRKFKYGVLERYRVYIGLTGKSHFIGYFKTFNEAVAARNKAILELHGEFAA